MFRKYTYCTTGMLLLLSVTTLFLVNYCPRFMLPFTLEISAIIPPFVIYLNRRISGLPHVSDTEMLQAAFCTRGRSRHRILTRNPYHKPAAFSDYLLGVLVSYLLGAHLHLATFVL